jgi:DNA-binding MarR family transcriptional regulator
METSANKNDPLAPRRNETPEEDAALLDKVLRPGSRLAPPRPVAAEDIPFRALGFMLSSLGHAVSKRFSLSLGPLDLEPREFALLRRVGLHEGSSQQLMGERLGIPASRIVALVDHLEGRGLLERRPSPTDRRAHALHLTPAGRRLLAKALDIAGAFEGELTQRLTDAQRAQLLEMLDAIATQLGIPSGVHGSQIHH